MKVKEIKENNDISLLKNMLRVIRRNVYIDNISDKDKKLTETTLRTICNSIVKSKHILLCSQKAQEIANKQRFNLFEMNNSQMSSFYRGIERELYAIYTSPIKNLLQDYIEDKINENDFINRLYLLWLTKEESDLLESKLKKNKHISWIDLCKELNINLTFTKNATPLDIYEMFLDNNIYDKDREILMNNIDFNLCNN